MTITEAAKRLRYAKLEAEIRRQGARLAVNFVFNTKVFYYVPVRGGNEEAMRSMPKNDLVKDAFVLELMKVQGYRGSGSTSRPATVRRAPELPASPSTPVAAGEGVEQLTYVPGVVPSPSALSPGTMLAASQQQLIHMSPAASGVQRANPPPMRRVLQDIINVPHLVLPPSAVPHLVLPPSVVQQDVLPPSVGQQDVLPPSVGQQDVLPPSAVLAPPEPSPTTHALQEMLVARDNTIRQQEVQLRQLYQTLQGMQACMTGVLGGAAVPASAVEPAVTPTPSPTANL